MAAAPADNTSTATAPDEGGGGDDETILVRTTLPILPLPTNDARPRLETARLLVRPLQQSDLAGLHALRTQPEAMTGTRLGRPDRDLAETQGALDFFLGHGDQWRSGPTSGRFVAVAREEASAVEHVYANAEPGNVGSCRVLEKLGFQRFHEWTEPDTQGHRIGQPLDLAGYLLASPDPTELRV
ncbi:hypothetical protein PG988_009221 [Apiospora saccharicola]